MGADSLHDVVVASSRLARADASLAIGVNMHMAALLNMVRMYRDGADRLAGALSGSRATACAWPPRSPSPVRT